MGGIPKSALLTNRNFNIPIGKRHASSLGGVSKMEIDVVPLINSPPPSRTIRDHGVPLMEGLVLAPLARHGKGHLSVRRHAIADMRRHRQSGRFGGVAVMAAFQERGAADV